MGLRSFFRSTVLRMDMLSAAPTFRTRKEPNYQTIFGGILSLIIMTIFTYILYVQLYYMYNHLSITYAEALSENISSEDTISDVKIAISIDGVDLAVNPRKFLFNLYQISHRGGSTTRRNLQLAQCNVSAWKTFGTGFQIQFNLFRFGEMMCIKAGQNLSLLGFFGGYTYEYLQLQISKCDPSLSVDCDTTANVNSYMANYLLTNDYFNVKLYVIDTIISPKQSNPLSYVMEKNIFLAFSQNIGTTGFITFSQYTIETDNNPWPIETVTQLTGSFIEKFHTNAVTRVGSKFITLSFFKSTKSLNVIRVIGKFDTVLSYVGGLFGILFGFIAFMIGSYSQKKYELYVAESLLKDDSGHNITSEDFNFLVYLGYSIYDWMDAFGYPPTSFKHFKKIHEIREEVNEHMHPVLVLKRIKYLENVCKMFTDQKQQLALHVKQPMTLSESKKMRVCFLMVEKLMSQLENKQLLVEKSGKQMSNIVNLLQMGDQQLEQAMRKDLLNEILSMEGSKQQEKTLQKHLPAHLRKLVLDILCGQHDGSMSRMQQIIIHPNTTDILTEGRESQMKQTKREEKEKEKEKEKDISYDDLIF